MRKTATAVLAAAGLAFVAGPVFAHRAPAPQCGDEVKKPTDDGKEPPKTFTDPQCGDGVKKPDDGKDGPPKT